MATERIRRRMEQLLDEADQALVEGQWEIVRDRAEKALALDPENADARTFLGAAERTFAAADQRLGNHSGRRGTARRRSAGAGCAWAFRSS